MRKILVILLFAAAVILPARFVAADEWPTRPVTVIVPYAAGGNVDVIARLIAAELSKRLQQPVLIENVAGAGGIIGTERASRVEPDGYTLLMSVESSILIAKLVSPKSVRYDGLRDFIPISLIATAPLALVGRTGLPANTVAELLDLARQQPGRLTYGTSGTGTSLHLAGEMFSQKGGVSLVHLPYRVGAQIPTDLSGGQIDLAVLSVTTVASLVNEGRIKIFGITEAKRTPLLPNAPSLSETPTLKDLTLTVWQGLFAPANTPSQITSRLQREMTIILAQDDLRAKLVKLGTVPSNLSGAEFLNFLKAEQENFSQVVKAGNIRAE